MKASCHGAVSILNATATGVGCALAIEDSLEAEWAWEPDRDGLDWRTGIDARVADAVLRHVRRTRGVADGAAAATVTDLPAARGLKTSSAAAGALLLAALRGLGERPPAAELAREAVQVSRQAGVSLTGAYDDQLAAVHGGCRLADNLTLDDLGPLPVPAAHVAVWVPDEGLPKDRVRAVDPGPVLAEARAAEHLARQGRVAEAMTRNGAAWTRLYQEAGLPVDPRPAQAALQAGALGAGLSGTGPAVAALFQDPVELDAVPGGAWRWTRTAEDDAGGAAEARHG